MWADLNRLEKTTSTFWDWRLSFTTDKAGWTVKGALKHRFALGLLALSTVMAAALLLVPGLRQFEGTAKWVLLFGAGAYVASVLTVVRWKVETREPKMQELRAVRRYLSKKLAECRANKTSSAPGLVQVLSDGVDYIDRQLAPTLEIRLQQFRENADLLERFSNGELPPPEPEVLKEQIDRNQRQGRAIDECVRQSSNALTALTELLQKGRDTDIELEVRSWADGLKDLLTVIDRDQTTENEAPVARPEGDSPCLVEATNEDTWREDWYVPVEEALRQLNNTAALAKSKLLQQIPETLEVACRAIHRNGLLTGPTAVEQAQALQEVLKSAIGRLKPPVGSVGPSVPQAQRQFHILHEHYVVGRPNVQIWTRLDITETRFFRERKEALSAVARHLQDQEERLAQRKSCEAIPA